MEFKENTPIYMQIANRIAEEILEGKYRGDERVPSVREYAARVEVNANTTMRAYEFLQQRNVIYNKRGIGYFVAPAAADIIMASRKKEFVAVELKHVFEQMRLLHMDMKEITALYEEYMAESVGKQGK